MNQITTAQKIAIFFQSKIDTNLALYLSIKDLNIYIRYLCYIFWSVTAPVAMYYLSRVVIDINTFELSINHLELLKSVFLVISICVFISCIIIFSYESVIKNNIDFTKLISEHKENIKKKKTEKKQWWRLRNMNLFFRLVSYISIWFVIIQAYYYLLISIIVNNNIGVEKKEMINAMNEFSLYLTVVMIVLISIIEYLNFKRKIK